MAISCLLKQDLLKSNTCGYSLPEITRIYLANYEEVSATTISAGTNGCEEVTAITMANDGVWYKIDPAKDSASFNDELVVGDAGNKYRTQTLTFTVSAAYTACLHGVLDSLSLGKYVAVIKTAEGTHLMLGRITGLEAESASFGGGGDTNGLVVTLTANTTESALPLSDDAVATVEG